MNGIAAPGLAVGGDRRRWLRSKAVVLSLAVHGLFARWVARLPSPARPRVADLELRAAPPRAVVPPPAPPAPPPPPQPNVVPVVRRAAAPPPPVPPPAAPPPTVEPPPEPPKVGVDEAATTPGGTMAVATGATLEGKVGTGTGTQRSAPAPAPAATGTGGGRGGVVPIYSVSRLPRPRQPIVPVAPESFRREPREALVVVEVDIDARGRVTAVRVVRSGGDGLDEAVLEAVRRTEFDPALVGDKPVGVRQQIPFRFRARG